MVNQDIRWLQRFDNFNSAFDQLKSAYELSKNKTLSELETKGFIHIFEFTHELAWNVLKDYIQHTGGKSLLGSKDTTREAFQIGLISDGNAWRNCKSKRITVLLLKPYYCLSSSKICFAKS